MKDQPHPGQPHPAFLRRLRSHNCAVLAASLLAALGATLVWVLLYFLGQWAVLSFLSSIEGPAATLPPSYDRWFGAFFFLVLLAVLLLRWLRPPGPIPDRPILGWHVLPEILLLPGSLLLACCDQWSAWQRLTPTRVATAWQLLRAFAERPKWPEPHLPLLGLDEKELPHALLLLQYAGLIHLHRGPHYWFYRLRSSEEETVQKWMSSTSGGKG